MLFFNTILQKEVIMSEVRYERYPNIEGALPITLYPHLVRSATAQSEKSNFHEEYELQLCLDGEGFVLVRGVRYAFRPGDILLVSPNEIHYTGSDSTLTYTALIFDGSLFCRLGVCQSAPTLPTRIENTDIQKAIERIETLIDKKEPYYIARCLSCIIDMLIALADCAVTKVESVSLAREERIVIDALKYIHAHYQEKISLDTVARAVLTDKYALCHAFSHMTGESLVSHLNRHRIGIAMGLLAKGETVAHTAEAVGFDNLSYFTKIFKRITGETPSRYREMGALEQRNS